MFPTSLFFTKAVCAILLLALVTIFRAKIAPVLRWLSEWIWRNLDTIATVGILTFISGKFFFAYVSIIPSPSMVPAILTSDVVIVQKEKVLFKNYTLYDFLSSMPQIGWRFRSEKVINLPSLKNGLIITFFNGDQSEYCKRIIGLPGDHVIFDNDDIFLNGESLTRDEDGKLFCDEEEYMFQYHGREFPLRKRICRIRTQRGKGEYIEFPYIFFPKQFIHDEIDILVPEGSVLGFGDNRDFSRDCRYSGFNLIPMSMIQGRIAAIIFGSKYDMGVDNVHMSWERFGLEFAYKIFRWFLAVDPLRIGSPYKYITISDLKPETPEMKRNRIQRANLEAELEQKKIEESAVREDLID